MSTPSAHKMLLDENLSWRVARALIASGYRAATTQSLGLNGLKDTAVFRHAQSQGYVIVTRDSDFLTNFAPPHHGIIVVLCPERAKNAAIVSCLQNALPQVLAGALENTITQIQC